MRFNRFMEVIIKNQERYSKKVIKKKLLSFFSIQAMFQITFNLSARYSGRCCGRRIIWNVSRVDCEFAVNNVFPNPLTVST